MKESLSQSSVRQDRENLHFCISSAYWITRRAENTCCMKTMSPHSQKTNRHISAIKKSALFFNRLTYCSGQPFLKMLSCRQSMREQISAKDSSEEYRFLKKSDSVTMLPKNRISFRAANNSVSL